MLESAPRLGVMQTCAAFGIARASYYRRRVPVHGPKQRRPSPARRMPEAERGVVLSTLHEPRFIDLASAEVHAMLLAESSYLCSVRMMHRILAENAETRERCDVLGTPNYAFLLRRLL